MRAGTDAERADLEALNVTSGPTFKAVVDPRVTRVGRLLRQSSLDELPQLWNVLRGHMSLVGPRPLVLKETAQLPERAMPRLLVKPGLTCTWQVSGRSLVTFDEWMAMDVEYVYQRSLRKDLGLLAKTPLAVLTGRGAY